MNIHTKGKEGKANLSEVSRSYRTAKEEHSLAFQQATRRGQAATEIGRQTGRSGFGVRWRALRRKQATEARKHPQLGGSASSSRLPEDVGGASLVSAGFLGNLNEELKTVRAATRQASEPTKGES